MKARITGLLEKSVFAWLVANGAELGHRVGHIVSLLQVCKPVTSLKRTVCGTQFPPSIL